MNYSLINNILIKYFGAFDYRILKFLHLFAKNTNNLFTNLFKLITFLTEKGIVFIILAVFLMLFKKTRKIGMCIFLAIFIGAVFTNFILKDSVQRLRPFLYNLKYEAWWKYVGSPHEDGYSFPSGHTTAAAAFMMALILTIKKKKKYLVILVPVLVGISRNYLVAHYPSDVLGAFLIGIIAAILSFAIVKLIYHILNKYNNKLFKFILNFNIIKKDN